MITSSSAIMTPPERLVEFDMKLINNPIMNLYELTYLIKPELTNDEAQEFNGEFTDELKEMGAKLYRMDQPKKRNLAYELKGFTEAYLACIDMDIEPEKVKLIEETLKTSDEVIRHMIISKDKLEEEEEPEEVKAEKEEAEEVNEEDVENEDQDVEEENEEEEVAEEEEEGEEEDKKSKKDKKVKLNEIDEKIDEIL